MELEGTAPEEKENQPLRERGVSTLRQWCEMNGYEGATNECIQSAMNQNNPQLVAMAKEHLMRGVAKNEPKL